MKSKMLIISLLFLTHIILSCSEQHMNPVSFQKTGVDRPNDAALTLPEKMEYNAANIEEGVIPKCIILPDFPDRSSAAFVLEHAAIQDDKIRLTLCYLGGCGQHEFHLVCTYVQEAGVLRIFAQIYHEQNNDPCEQLVTETREIDLSPIKELNFSDYNNSGDQVIISLIEAGGMTEAFSLVYKFCEKNHNPVIPPEPPLPPVHNPPTNNTGS